MALQPSALRVCKALYAAGKVVFYRQNAFVFGLFHHCYHFTQMIDTKAQGVNSHNIRRIALGMEEYRAVTDIVKMFSNLVRLDLYERLFLDPMAVRKRRQYTGKVGRLEGRGRRRSPRQIQHKWKKNLQSQVEIVYSRRLRSRITLSWDMKTEAQILIEGQNRFREWPRCVLFCLN